MKTTNVLNFLGAAFELPKTSAITICKIINVTGYRSRKRYKYKQDG